MKTNSGEYYTVYHNPQQQIRDILQRIQSHIHTQIEPGTYSVFLTSDCDLVYSIARDIFGDCVLYNTTECQHIDRKVSGDFSKFYIDNYILSQRTTSMYISAYSNYGRIAGLSAQHSNIYDLECNPVVLHRLVSKHEIL